MDEFYFYNMADAEKVTEEGRRFIRELEARMLEQVGVPKELMEPPALVVSPLIPAGVYKTYMEMTEKLAEADNHPKNIDFYKKLPIFRQLSDY